MIAFTQSFSIRSTKLHLRGARDAFARAFVCSVIDPELEEDYVDIDTNLQLVSAVIGMVTDHFSLD